jgi:hypothetical protein
MTQKYRFIGTEEKYFPDLGAELKPGDEIDLDVVPNNPELVPVKAKPDTTKKEGD